MPDDLGDLEDFEQRAEEYHARVSDVQLMLEAQLRTRDIWKNVGADWSTVWRWSGSTLDRAQRNLDAAESRLDRLQARPPRPANAPAQEGKPAPRSPTPEPARSLWDRLSEAEEDSPPGSPATRPQRAPGGTQSATLEPRPWWPPFAVYAAASMLVLALLAWAWYSVP